MISITIAAIGAIAAVGSAICACCNYKLNQRSGKLNVFKLCIRSYDNYMIMFT